MSTWFADSPAGVPPLPRPLLTEAETAARARAFAGLDRRRSPRRTVASPALLRPLTAALEPTGESVRAAVVDVSEGGIRLLALRNVAGTRFAVRLAAGLLGGDAGESDDGSPAEFAFVASRSQCLGRFYEYAGAFVARRTFEGGVIPIESPGPAADDRS